MFLHAEVYTVELNQSRFVGRSAGVEFTMGLAKLASPSRTLRSEGGALQKECHATYNLKLNPMRVKLPTPFEGPLSGEGACVRLSQIIDDLCSYTRTRRAHYLCRLSARNYCLLHTSQVDCLPIQATCTLKTDTFFTYRKAPPICSWTSQSGASESGTAGFRQNI